MNLKEIRIKRGLSQQTVSEYIGCSSGTYSRYETEIRQPSIDILIKLSDLFGVTIDFLVGKEDIEESTLSAYEKSLVTAARHADDRAREDALKLLIIHN